MSDPNNRNDDRKRRLECLRLAADFRQLARETSAPDKVAQYLRMAEHWTAQADAPDPDDTGGS